MARKKVIEIVLDTETTGLDYTREKMVEFAALRLENGKIKDEFQTLINPEQHIRKSSIAIHGITPDMVEDAPTEAEAMPKILEFIGDYPIVAHNAILITPLSTKLQSVCLVKKFQMKELILNKCSRKFIQNLMLMV